MDLSSTVCLIAKDMSLSKLLKYLETLQDKIFRAKGYLHLVEGAFYIELAGDQLSWKSCLHPC